MLACAIHDRRVAGAVARARHTQRLMLHAPQAEAAVLKFKEAALRTESCSSNQAAAAASCAVVCCATNGYGRQPLAAAAVQTRHRDCCIIVAAGRPAVTMFHNAKRLTSHRCTLCTSNRALRLSCAALLQATDPCRRRLTPLPASSTPTLWCASSRPALFRQQAHASPAAVKR